MLWIGSRPSSQPRLASDFLIMTKTGNNMHVTAIRAKEFALVLQVPADDNINWRPFIIGKVDLDGIAGAFESLKNPENHAKMIVDPSRQGASIIPISL